MASARHQCILTCNAGSSSLKVSLVAADTGATHARATLENHAALLPWVQQHLQTGEIIAVGHRVVHGGQQFTQPVVCDDSVMPQLQALVALAPLHQPPALALIAAAQQQWPDVPHVACFDTAFHRTQPALHQQLALPKALVARHGLYRYGFHGLSYQYIASILPQQIPAQAEGKILVAHLGSGASVCALHQRRSVGSSMGFSTLDGLMMATRCGQLDAGVVLHLLQHYTPADVAHMLYHESGLLGVSGISSDMRMLIDNPEPAAQEAVALFCLTAARQMAGLLPLLGGCDAVVFTAGIGEHQPVIRQRIMQHLKGVVTDNIPVLVIPTNEEAVLAAACQASGALAAG